ncbi:MAG: GGDEF domain-containing protein [Lachnospiraceae bacterium]|nr:GGDEF domain-containing protein [Lachnospiraceae bacterium]
MKNRVYHILYGIMVITFVIMVGWMFIDYEGTSVIKANFEKPTDFSTGWTLENGDEVDVSKLRDVEGTKLHEAFSVYHRIPADWKEGEYLCFRSKNVFFRVYLDGELIYEPYVPENIFSTKGPGTSWNYIPISVEDADKQLEFRVTKVYESGTMSFDSICVGEPARAIMDKVEEKLVAFITCILTLFVGFILIIADIPINMRAQKNHELMYLGMFSVSVAAWCLVETNLLQYYLGNARAMQFISCNSLMLISIPMTLYLDAAFGFRKRGAMIFMIGVSFVSYVVAMVLHFTGIADVHETLHFSHVVLIMTAVVLFYTIIRNTFVMSNSTGRNIYRVLRGVGLCGLSVATVIDIIRYYNQHSSDTAMFVRIGLLIFILCFGTSSLEKTVNAVKLGVQTEFVSQLAYRDGLTRIGNRTAFEERLVELEKVKSELDAIGIIMFDVNDLKFVNDNFGHRVGDSMLMESAALIEDAFMDQQGDCFRIGGDEFVVVLSGDNVVKRYEAGIEHFKESMKQFNLKKDKEFRISIAHGFATYNQTDENKPLMTVYQQADMLMYEDKKRIKAKQITAEAYYHTGVLTSENA